MSNIREGIDPYKGKWFSLGNRLGRALFGICWLVFCRWTPRPFSPWRVIVLRLFKAKIGKGCYIDQSAEIWAPWNLVVEDEVAIAPRVFLYSMETITLKYRSIVSLGSTLCAGTHDYLDPHFQLQSFPIEVGAKAWIAAESFVHPGVTIGEGAVLGARSVAVKDLEPWGVYGGHPAKFLKKRVMKEINQ